MNWRESDPIGGRSMAMRSAARREKAVTWRGGQPVPEHGARGSHPTGVSAPRAVAIAAALLLCAATSAVASVRPAHADAAAAKVTVNVRAGLATVPATGLGVNDAVWDGQLGTTAVSDLLKGA